MTFWLREDDPAFKEDDANILATLKEDLKRLHHPEEDFGIDDGMHHNPFQGRDGHPLQGEFHYWLYHGLYDHTALWFDAMLRIGRIWVNMPVIYQHTSAVVA